MRTQIFTADIVNLETVTVNEEDGSEIRTPTIVPNVEGEMTVGVNELVGLSNGITEHPDSDCRLIVIVSPDATPVFYDDALANYFDPIERVADIEAGNIGSIVGMQVIRGLQAEHPYVAVVEVRDADTVEILRYNASVVKL
ncbi:hypothetical protein MPK71_gp246 [Erwinia phage pEa_SNUABM_1]|uniref:Uncharacterized protein n=1 Tax=Erwinia phage pEa_SNUABM_1 TaxID=2869543 RepID=A0AAE7XL38_9CAUD|nr:hypothetical protein MPK71_gp246 [Erwinia phage pEa_SNUABM_1]QZE57455.1 hypothetical protein pEaSNUABM1_00246 [Erwinia phage pEa_SNUABM_1]